MGDNKIVRLFVEHGGLELTDDTQSLGEASLESGTTLVLVI